MISLPLFEKGEIVSEGGSGCDSWPSDKSSSDGGDDGTIEIRHEHDVELLWSFDQLHACVINDHLFVLELRVSGGNLSTAVKEKSINKLPN